MSFSRRRTALACTYCRHRKRRCDAATPSCRNCVEADVDCQYDDAPSQRIDTSGGTREILGRLRDIQELIESQGDSIAALPFHTGNGGSQQSRASPSETFQQALPTRPAWGPWYTGGVGAETDASPLAPLTIPIKHKTSSTYLLSLPAMQTLVGEYPRDLFFRIESRNPLPPELSAETWSTPPSRMPIDQNVTDELVSAFFTSAHLHHPILDESEFSNIYQQFLERDTHSSIESALCMVVFALGEVSCSTPDPEKLANSPPGMAYMQHALPIIMAMSSWSFHYRLILPQAMVLASLYFAYIVRPLQSWRLVYSASSILQFKFSGLDAAPEGLDSIESTLRLFWSCFLIECDRLAELELPRSSLQQLTDETSLPNCTHLGEMESTSYLAEISIRRLLNRVHHSIYPRREHVLSLSSTTLSACDSFTSEEISAMSAVCGELHRQLDMWHTSIPEQYRPSLGLDLCRHDREAVLRIRYFATRHIIYRPFVLYICGLSYTDTADQAILEKAQLCIESCRLYLHNTSVILKRPSQYTWTFSLSSLGAVIVLTLSSLNPHLRHLCPDIDQLQTLAITNIRPWAISSLEAVVSILEDVQKKQRLLSRV